MRASLALAAVIVLAPLAAGAQPAAKVSRNLEASGSSTSRAS